MGTLRCAMASRMDEKREYKPAFTWRDWVFGKNVIAGCLWMLIGISAYILVLALLVGVLRP